MSPLTNQQKRLMVMLALRAFNREAALARGRGETFTTTFDTFRHTQIAAATGKIGLRCCDQADYKRIEAHLLEMLGEHGAAFEAHMRAETEPKRQAEALLVRELAKAGFDPAYADRICLAQNKCQVPDATAQQIMRLVFTIRNRAAAKRKQAA